MTLEAPKHLSPEATEEFNRLVNAEGADFREFELRPLERYCQLIMDVRRLQEEVSFQGEILFHPINKTQYHNPRWVALQNKETRLLTLEKELGFTVKARRDKAPQKMGRNLRNR